MTAQIGDPSYDAGYLAGATWGITHAWEQIEERDERLARRIVALLLQHDYQGELVRTVVTLHPYPGRTATGINWRERLNS